MFENLFKNTSKSLKRVSLSLRALIGTVATAAYIQSDVRLAFWFLVGGAVLDFIIQLLPPDTEIKSGTKVLVVLVSVALLWLSGCGSTRPIADSVVKTDTTTITYKPIDVAVKGASVNQGLNIDSLFKDWEIRYHQYLVDSTDAANSGKPLPKPPVVPPTSKADPDGKVKLTYGIDQNGKLQVTCESQDQVIQVLVAEINRLRTENKTKTVVEYRTPAWNYVAFGVLGLLSVFGLIFLLTLFKR